jgi:hypothetical protein
MQYFYDPANGDRQYAFNPDVVVTGSAGSWVFETAGGVVLGPYPATLVAGMAPVAVVTPTLAQQAVALLAAGLAITSTATPAISATYPCDDVSQGKYSKSLQGLQQSGGATFIGGAATWPIRDMAEVWHPCTPAQYVAIVSAIGAFVAACDLVIDGLPGAVLPVGTASIP